MNKSLSQLQLAVFIYLLCGQVSATESVDWLYEYEGPVMTQSIEEQNQLIREGLQAVLIRVTGLAQLPRNEVLTRAYSNLDAYHLESRYASRRTASEEDAGNYWLSVKFNPMAVQGLVRDAGLPLWPSVRPRLLVVPTTPVDNVRTVLTATSGHLLIQSIEESAMKRGLPISFPVMDLTESQHLSVGSVAFGFFEAFRFLQKRYSINLIATARVDTVYTGRHRLWLQLHDEKLINEWVLETSSVEETGSKIIDLVVQQLTRIYAVSSTDHDVLRMVVEGISTPQAYLNLMDYLEEWEFIDEVVLRSHIDEELELELSTGTTWDQFITYIQDDPVLASSRDTLDLQGPTRRFIWRGSK